MSSTTTTTTTTTTSKRTSYTRPSSTLATSTSAPNTSNSMAIPTGNFTATPTSLPPTSTTIFAMDRPTARVRFDASCILIPESSSVSFAGGGSKRPRMVTKSYSLPLWKKQKWGEDMDDGEESGHVVLKVALPSFKSSKNSSSSTSRQRDLRPLSAPPLTPTARM
ncbi:hypothetical protein C8F04DRAFT_1132931 [Mycena alexandri]|uniref:Uncharacterized protein n=1 Tax=Mycena alexandri TaxID=1745969 RepID=A0AAD6S9S4_9AGAR|nr:hypothetical protein C8F04DRAFT_1132931 [Mycena alexandri]